ncbi:DUF1254 domain-containing protein [Vibrio chagasii]|nr:DUF1254 domain-containing protein [Vibrio chagasii]
MILPPGYEEVPEGYFTSQSTSHTNWFIARGFLKDGKTDAAVKAYKKLKICTILAKKDDQPEMEFTSRVAITRQSFMRTMSTSIQKLKP